MKHPQFEYLIEEAQKRVAEQGTATEPSDIMLSGFGFIADVIRDELKPPPSRSMKWLITLSTAATAIILSLAKTITERF